MVKKKKAFKRVTSGDKLTVGKRLETTPFSRYLVLVVFGFSGGAALIYEVIWTRMLSLVFGSSTYAVSTMLTAFMTGLTVGSFLGGMYIHKTKRSLNYYIYFLGFIEITIGVFGLISILGIEKVQILYFDLYKIFRVSGRPFGLFIFGEFLISLIIMLIPTSLMGATFPLAGKIYTTELDFVGKRIGELYSVNTLGSIVGSFSAGFLLIPLIGIYKAALVAGSINILNGVIIMIAKKKLPAIILGVLACFPLLIVASGKEINPPFFNVHSLGIYENFEDFQAFKSGLKRLYLSDDINGLVSVFLTKNGTKFLRVSGRNEGGTSSLDMLNQTVSGKLPMAFFPKERQPKNALLIGLGTGITLSKMADFPLVSLDCVEVNGSVLQAAANCFSSENENVLKDRRVEVTIADGRAFLNSNDKKYDLITSVPSFPTNPGVSNLLTEEFYGLVRNHLNPGGVLFQWAPKYIFSADEYKILVKTIGKSFKKNIVVYDFGGDAFFVCSDREIKPDIKAANSIIAAEKLSSSHQLNAWRLDERTISSLVMDESILSNKDDKPILEFRAIVNRITNPRAEERLVTMR